MTPKPIPDLESHRSETFVHVGPNRPLESDPPEGATAARAPELPALVIVVGSAATDKTLLDKLLASGAVLLVASRADQVKSWLAGDLIQRSHPEPDPDGELIRLDNLTIDLREHQVFWRGLQLRLSERELGMLQALAQEPHRAWSFRELQERVWSGVYFGDRSQVKVAIRRLRIKLRDAGVTVGIESVKGFGFRLSVP